MRAPDPEISNIGLEPLRQDIGACRLCADLGSIFILISADTSPIFMIPSVQYVSLDALWNDITKFHGIIFGATMDIQPLHRSSVH